MKKPVKPYPPFKGHYDAKVERKYIYSFYRDAHEDDYDDKEENDWTKDTPAKNVDEIDLAWLCSQAPEGITPDKIKVELGDDSCCMSFDGYFVRFYYEVTIPAKKAKFKADMEKYEDTLVQFRKDEVTYKEWCHQEEIRMTEEKLSRLKKGN